LLAEAVLRIGRDAWVGQRAGEHAQCLIPLPGPGADQQRRQDPGSSVNAVATRCSPTRSGCSAPGPYHSKLGAANARPATLSQVSSPITAPTTTAVSRATQAKPTGPGWHLLTRGCAEGVEKQRWPRGCGEVEHRVQGSGPFVERVVADAPVRQLSSMNRSIEV